MPRIYTSQNDALDFCKRDFPKSEHTAMRRYGNLGNGPNGRGNCFSYEADHPPYEDAFYDNYKCAKCKKHLTENDN